MKGPWGCPATQQSVRWQVEREQEASPGLGAWDSGQQPLPCSSEPAHGPCSLSLHTKDQTRLRAVSSLSGLQSHGQPWAGGGGMGMEKRPGYQ